MGDPRESGSGAVRRKAVAFLLSGIFPGLGQFYNRQPIKGSAFALAGAALGWLMTARLPSAAALLREPERAADLLLPSGVLLLIWLWSLVDAWRIAGR